MTETQFAQKIQEASRRYGPKLAVANALRALSEDDIMSLWNSVGPRIAREVWRRHRPQIELVRSVQGALSELVPIGTSGERRALGSMGAKELRVIAQFRQRMGETLVDQGRLIRRVADAIGAKTVGEAWDTIPARDRKALLDAFGIGTPDSGVSNVA